MHGCVSVALRDRLGLCYGSCCLLSFHLIFVILLLLDICHALCGSTEIEASDSGLKIDLSGLIEVSERKKGKQKERNDVVLT